MEFCRKLSATDGKTYRLPTEAEWEYACRAGTTTAYSFGDDAARLSEYGWWGGTYGNGNAKSEQYAHAVGTKRPNGFGLYDMHGNVWEWCSDWYGDYGGEASTDPLGADTGSLRVYRGGSWFFYAGLCRSAFRSGSSPDYESNRLSFRVALSLEPYDASVPPAAALRASRSMVSPFPAGDASGGASPQAPPPRAIAPFSENEAKSHQAAWAAYLDQPVEFTNSVGMKLKLIPAGIFMMGSPDSDKDAKPHEKPQRQVTLRQSFYMGETEVTQSQWKIVMGTEPWKSKGVKEGANYPAMYVSWGDATAYCERLSASEGRPYRLPTEAEWEYACRGGTTTRYSFGDNATSLSDYAWWGGLYGNGNAKNEQYTHEVKLKRANAFGLYDMKGNVWEWCSDWYHEKYSNDDVTDPRGPSTGSVRAFRGGSWGGAAFYCRSAHRNSNRPTDRANNNGFRVVLSSAGGQRQK
jgi:formylglycine-generating enzyme required for sulfatase activity